MTRAKKFNLYEVRLSCVKEQGSHPTVSGLAVKFHFRQNSNESKIQLQWNDIRMLLVKLCIDVFISLRLRACVVFLLD